MRILLRNILLLLAVVTSARAQILLPVALRADLPGVEAKFYLFDSLGGIVQDLEVGDLNVTEGPMHPGITSMTLPVSMADDPISLTIMVDIGNPPGHRDGRQWLDLGTALATTITDRLPHPHSEIAVGTCNTRSSINHDFTNDRSRIHAAIDSITPSGISEYTEMFLNKDRGALTIARRHHYRPALLVIANASGRPLEDWIEQLIGDSAVTMGMRLFAVVCGPRRSGERWVGPGLRRLAERTGGAYFDGVVNEDGAMRIARMISGMLHTTPISCIWKTSAICPGAGAPVISIPRLGVSAQASYLLPGYQMSRLRQFELSRTSMPFRGISPGESANQTFSIKVVKGPATIHSITSSDPRFSIVDFGGAPPPFVITPDSGRIMQVRYAPTDSAYVAATIDVAVDECSYRLWVSGGFPGAWPSMNPITLLAPNGGEILGSRMDTVIEWRGTSIEDAVRLEYSVDDGATWKLITNEATRFRYRWRVPDDAGSRCRVRASFAGTDTAIVYPSLEAVRSGVAFDPTGRMAAFISRNGIAQIVDAVGGALVASFNIDETGFRTQSYMPRMAWHPDGKHIALIVPGPTIAIVDPITGQRVRSLTGHTDVIKSVAWSHSGALLASGSSDRTLRIWSAKDGHVIAALKGHRNDVTMVAWSPDDSRVAAVSAEGSALIWSIASKDTVAVLKHLGSINDVAWSRDGTRLVTASSDWTATVWNTSTWQPAATIAETGWVRRAAWSNDGASIMTMSIDGVVRQWDAVTGKEIRSFASPISEASVAMALSPDGDRFATIAADGSTYVWDVATGASRAVDGPDGGWDPDGTPSIAWNPLGGSLGVASPNGKAKILFVDRVATPRSDQSDSSFTIGITPALEDMVVDEVDFGEEMAYGMLPDTTVSAFIRNTGSVPIYVADLAVGPTYDYHYHGNEFNLNVDLPRWLSPGDSISADFTFYPYREWNLRSLPLTAIINGDTLEGRIHGGTTLAPIALPFARTYFDTVRVGSVGEIVRSTWLESQIDRPIHVTGISLRGPGRSNFAIIDSQLTFTLAPGEIRGVALQFRPRVKGRLSASLVVEHDEIGSPYIVDLIAEGVEGVSSVGAPPAALEKEPGENLFVQRIGESIVIHCSGFEHDNPRVELYNVLGDLMRVRPLDPAGASYLRLQVGDLPAGVYVLLVRGERKLVSRTMMLY